MDKQKAIATAKPYFKSYPTVQDMHVTHDGQVFTERHHAENHAKSFHVKEEQVIHTVNKEDGLVSAEQVAVTPLIIGVPAEAIINSEKPETVMVVSDSEAEAIAKALKGDKPSDGEIIEGEAKTGNTAKTIATMQGKDSIDKEAPKVIKGKEEKI